MQSPIENSSVYDQNVYLSKSDLSLNSTVLILTANISKEFQFS